MQVPCQKCGQPIEVPDLQWEIINSLGISMIALHHTYTIRCICGTEWIPTIMGFQPATINVALNIKPAQQEPSRIIHPN